MQVFDEVNVSVHRLLIDVVRMLLIDFEVEFLDIELDILEDILVFISS